MSLIFTIPSASILLFNAPLQTERYQAQAREFAEMQDAGPIGGGGGGGQWQPGGTASHPFGSAPSWVPSTAPPGISSNPIDTSGAGAKTPPSQNTPNCQKGYSPNPDGAGCIKDPPPSETSSELNCRAPTSSEVSFCQALCAAGGAGVSRDVCDNLADPKLITPCKMATAAATVACLKLVCELPRCSGGPTDPTLHPWPQHGFD